MIIARHVRRREDTLRETYVRCVFSLRFLNSELCRPLFNGREIVAGNLVELLRKLGSFRFGIAFDEEVRKQPEH